jgi:large subunit ribosomal protein L9
MKVVLTQDVPKVGDLGTIQDVKDGFARNYLIPHGFARIATPGMIKQVEERQDAELRRIAHLEEEMRDLAGLIDGIRLEIHARVGEQGRLFGSVTAADIAERLSEITGHEIDRRKVELEAPLREVGEVRIPIRLVGRLVPEITVAVFDPAAPLLATPFEEDEYEDEEAETYAVEVEGIEAETQDLDGSDDLLEPAGASVDDESDDEDDSA